jgi:cobalamin biosynthesis Mg chelatase CobN
MRGPRRGRLAALAASAGLAMGLLLLVGSGAPTAAAPRGPCVSSTVDPADPCPDTTTTTTAPTTTTTIEETTTTFVETTSTRGQTATTQEVVQTTTSTSLDVSTSQNVLVPGDGTEGAESTTTTTESPTTISNDDTSDGALLALIVGGLVLLAVVVGILTWRYWVATRPPLKPAVGSDHG